jgi:hypothetical protein
MFGRALPMIFPKDAAMPLIWQTRRIVIWPSASHLK